VWLEPVTETTALYHAARVKLAAKELAQYVEFFLVAWLVLGTAVKDRCALGWTVVVLVAAAAAAVGLAGFQYFQTAAGPESVRAAFANRGFLGAYLAIVVPVLAGLALWDPRWWVKLASAALVAGGLFVTLAAGPFVVTAGVVLVMCVARTRWAVPAAGALVVVLGLIYPMGGADDALDRWPVFRQNPLVLLRSAAPYDTDKERPNAQTLEWQVALGAFDPTSGVYGGAKRRFLVGTGVGNYGELESFYGAAGVDAKAEEDIKEPGTNPYIRILAVTAGIPAVVLFAAALAGAAAAAGRCAGRAAGWTRGVAWGLVGGVSGLGLVTLATEPLSRAVGVAAILVLVLAWRVGEIGRGPASEGAGLEPGGNTAGARNVVHGT
jgi:hypothetical protein